MRAKTLKYQACDCGAYHYPHRRGSGRCNFHPDGGARQWEAFEQNQW